METVLTESATPTAELQTDYGLVSVIMPNYNSAPFIEETVNSVLAQTYTNWELIIVDDCSTDNSLEVLQSFTDPRIRILSNDQNSGAAVTRNRAIEAANGRWIAFLDSDDLWDKEKLSRHLSYMTQNDIAFSFTSYSVISESGEYAASFSPVKDVYDYKAILKHNYIGCSTVVYDSGKLGKICMPENAEKREDHACWLYILRTCSNAYCLHDLLTSYRLRGKSVSSSKRKMIKYQWRVYRNVEQLSAIRSAYYMAHWALNGVLKYRKLRKTK